MIAQQLYMKFLFHDPSSEYAIPRNFLSDCYRHVLKGDITSSGSL